MKFLVYLCLFSSQMNEDIYYETDDPWDLVVIEMEGHEYVHSKKCPCTYTNDDDRISER